MYQFIPAIKFNPHIFGKDWDRVGCGITTLSLITGEHPEILSSRYKKEAKDFPDKVMISHLENKKIKVFQLHLSATGKFNPLQQVCDENIILATVRMTEKEATWVVLYRGIMWHNFVGLEMNVTTLINYPIKSAYVLMKKEWIKKTKKPNVSRISMNK